MNPHYETEFKKKIVHLHLKEGHTLRDLAEEYGVSKASILNPLIEFHEECQTKKPKPIIII